VDIVKQNQQKVWCELLRDKGQNVQSELLTGSGQTVEDISGEKDREPTGVQC